MFFINDGKIIVLNYNLVSVQIDKKYVYFNIMHLSSDCTFCSLL